MGHRWLTLPPHALNLKIGKFDTGVLMPVLSQNRRIGIEQAVRIQSHRVQPVCKVEPAPHAGRHL